MSESAKKSVSNEFREWAEKLKHRIAPKFKIEFGKDDSVPNQGAWINLTSNDRIGIMMVWDTGEYEYYFQEISTGENHSYFYGNEIIPSQFEQLFSPVILEYTK
jgi:hypothetical protein